MRRIRNASTLLLVVITSSILSLVLTAQRIECTSVKEAELYKIDIHQKTPRKGIETGHVIAYGHYVKPPYEFRIVNDTLLFLNGVQAHPLLPSKAGAYRMKKLGDKVKKNREEDPEYYRRKDRLMNIREVEAMYKRIYEVQGQEAAIESVYSFYKEDTVVIYDVKVAPEGTENASVALYFNPSKGKPYDPAKYRKMPCSFSLRIHPHEKWYPLPPPKNEAERIARKKEFFEGQKKSGETTLSKGRVLICGEGNWNTRSGSYLCEIVEIMKKPTLSPGEKYEALSMIGIWSKEIIYNFDSQRWPDCKAEGGEK